MTHALISIHPAYALQILRGTKRVEVRTRPVRIAPGTRLWIYSTLPVGAIQAFVTVTGVELLPPTRAWHLFEASMCLTRSAFRKYVNGNASVSIIGLDAVRELAKPLTLELIRKSVPRFQPPQFLKKVETGALYELLAKHELRLR